MRGSKRAAMITKTRKRAEMAGERDRAAGARCAAPAADGTGAGSQTRGRCVAWRRLAAAAAAVVGGCGCGALRWAGLGSCWSQVTETPRCHCCCRRAEHCHRRTCLQTGSAGARATGAAGDAATVCHLNRALESPAPVLLVCVFAPLFIKSAAATAVVSAAFVFGVAAAVVASQPRRQLHRRVTTALVAG